MALNTRGDGLLMNLMDKGHITIIMEMSTRVSGKMEIKMAKEYLLGSQAIYMKGIGLMENAQEMELCQ